MQGHESQEVGLWGALGAVGRLPPPSSRCAFYSVHVLRADLLSRVQLCGPIARRGSSVQGILQARMLEWVTVPFSGRSSPPRDRTQVSCIACTGRQILYH